MVDSKPVTKADLKADLKRFATKDDLKRFATKDDLKRFATKDDLKRFATKDDLTVFKHEIQHDMNQFKHEIRADIVEIKDIINQKINHVIWFVSFLIVTGFSIGIFFIYDKLSFIDDKFTERVAFMNEQYSDRFSRIEARIVLSSPEVLELIKQLKKTSIEKQKNRPTGTHTKKPKK